MFLVFLGFTLNVRSRGARAAAGRQSAHGVREGPLQHLRILEARVERVEARRVPELQRVLRRLHGLLDTG